MDESWGLKSVLDAMWDIPVFVVSERDDRILYINHIAAIKTGRHQDSLFTGLWEQVREHMAKCGEGRTYRFYEADTPFGKYKNVTIMRLVWVGGIKAYAFMVSPHVENKEEQEREIILGTLGRSYVMVQTLDPENRMIHTIYSDSSAEWNYFRPVSVDEWRSKVLGEMAHPDDQESLKEALSDENAFINALNENEEGITLQFRRRMKDDYRWTEMRMCWYKNAEISNVRRLICTLRDIHGELVLNKKNLEKELILKSLSNIYRSVYLLDLITGNYTTVKPDTLLFGIRDEGAFEDMLAIVSDFIPDNGQKKDLQEYFSVSALRNAFEGEVENIGREYNSEITGGNNWMSISACRPPKVQGMENKCVVTFMDISQHKRVEKERDEGQIALDVLSSRYIAIFFVNARDYTYHALRLPSSLKYLEKQYPSVIDAFDHYLSCYVLDEYRESMAAIMAEITKRNASEFVGGKREFVYRTIDDKWRRFSITAVEMGDTAEFILSFEDYNDIYEELSHSAIYSKMILADYEHIYEYDPESDYIYELRFDGERLTRIGTEFSRKLYNDINISGAIHPDDAESFQKMYCIDTINENLQNGKSVSHMIVRRMRGDQYHSYIYGFHYYSEYGKKCVLIMERDADKEKL